MNIQQAIARLVERHDLTQEESRLVMDQIMSGEATEAQIGGYAVALRMKGETVDEIAGAAQAMRDKAVRVRAGGVVVDTCGTGGDASGTFNISTTAAFVVAACGVTVAKHGNRSISSKSGSADLLRALGVNIEAPLPVVEACLEQIGLGFLFAPRHHGAMRHAAAPRQQLAVRTLFNLLGPLTNPAGAPHQVMGVFAPQWVEPLAQVLGRLGAKRAMVVHGHDGLDEITLTGPTQVAEWRDGRVQGWTLDPAGLGLHLCQPEELKGGDADTNARITWDILEGHKGPKRQVVALNAAAALTVTGMAPDLAEGLKLAQAALDDGSARHKLERLIALTNAGG